MRNTRDGFGNHVVIGVIGEHRGPASPLPARADLAAAIPVPGLH